jgi:hypothetical protein
MITNLLLVLAMNIFMAVTVVRIITITEKIFSHGGGGLLSSTASLVAGFVGGVTAGAVVGGVSGATGAVSAGIKSAGGTGGHLLSPSGMGDIARGVFHGAGHGIYNGAGVSNIKDIPGMIMGDGKSPGVISGAYSRGVDQTIPDDVKKHSESQRGQSSGEASGAGPGRKNSSEFSDTNNRPARESEGTFGTQSVSKSQQENSGEAKANVNVNVNVQGNSGGGQGSAQSTILGTDGRPYRGTEN